MASDYSAIQRARLHGWLPTRPEALSRYHQALDYESPGDDEFLEKLAFEADVWLADNEPEHVKTYCHWCGNSPPCPWYVHHVPEDDE